MCICQIFAWRGFSLPQNLQLFFLTYPNVKVRIITESNTYQVDFSTFNHTNNCICKFKSFNIFFSSYSLIGLDVPNKREQYLPLKFNNYVRHFILLCRRTFIAVLYISRSSFGQFSHGFNTFSYYSNHCFFLFIISTSTKQDTPSRLQFLVHSSDCCVYWS